MAFHGFVGIPDPVDPNKSVSGVLRRWCVNEGDFTTPNQLVAIVEIAGIEHRVTICFPALIMELYTAANSIVTANDSILKWAADGEDIPYGRPYFKSEVGKV